MLLLGKQLTFQRGTILCQANNIPIRHIPAKSGTYYAKQTIYFPVWNSIMQSKQLTFQQAVFRIRISLIADPAPVFYLNADLDPDSEP
jgi:hypothetical protein